MNALLHPFDRWMNRLLPGLAAVTPLVIVYALVRPNISQAYFMQIVVFLLAAAHGVAYWMGWRRPPQGINWAGGLLILNLGVLIVSVLATRKPMFMIYALKNFMLPLSAILFGVMLVRHPARRPLLERLGITLVVVAALLAAYGIAQYFHFEFLPYSPEVQKNTVIATIGHPNYLASVLGPMVFVMIGFICARRSPAWVIVGGSVCAALLFCIYLARTRGVWLGLLTGGFTFFILGIRYGTVRKLGSGVFRGFLPILGIIAAGLGLCVLVVLPLLDEQINLVDRLASDKEIKSRLFYWNAAIDLTWEKPVLGQGYARFDPLFWDYVLALEKGEMGKYYADFLPAISGHTPDHVHNEYLEVMCEQGLLGLFSLLLLLGFFLYFGYHAIIREPELKRGLQGIALYAALVCALTDALFAFPWRLPVSLLVFMLILAWLYDYIYPQKPAASY